MQNSQSDYIFELTNPNFSYKGVLFAEADDEEIHKQTNCPFPLPSKIEPTGILALIWTDEKGIWHSKMRIKFPSGNKQVFSRDYEEEFKENININETYVLNDIYKMPMKNKHWYKNQDGTIHGMLHILEKSNMIEWKRSY